MNLYMFFIIIIFILQHMGKIHTFLQYHGLDIFHRVYMACFYEAMFG